MKDIENIEELINSYIDNELDERKSNEIKRLINNDPEARQMFESVSRYKNLVGSLRSSAAPEGFCEGVKRDLEREMLLADTEIYQHKKGRSRLVLRHFLTAAAMIALLAMLSYVILDIFVPQSTRQKFAQNVFHRKPKPQVIYDNGAPAVAAAQDKAIEVPKGPAVPLIARLTLVTENPIEADWLVGKALMNTSLFEKTSAVDRKTNSVKYVLSCDRKSLVGLVQELSFIWPKCSDAILEVGTQQQGKFVTIDNISAHQALDICKADSYNQRLRMAADISAINKAADTDILKNYFANKNAESELVTADKPALTSTEKVAQQQTNISTDPANLTIIVIGK
jgi:hypothetical protein